MSVFGISLLISIFLWLIIDLSKERTHSFRFKVHYEAWPEACIPSQAPDSIVEVSLHASGFELLSFMLKPAERILYISDAHYPSAKVDECLKAEIPVSKLLVSRFGEERVKRLQMSPDPALLSISTESALARKVPVIPQLTMTMRQGFGIVGPIMANPDSVILTGPASMVSEIREINTETIELDDVHEDFSLSAVIHSTVWNISVRPEEVMLSADIDKMTEKVIEVNLPDYANGIDEHFLTIPSKVDVHLNVPISLFDSFGPEDIQLSLIKRRDGNYLTVKINSYPESSSLVRFTPEEVEYFVIPDPE